jgi:aromatic-L-amino-acid decarboxylase
MAILRDALSLVPEYMRTTDGRAAGRDYAEFIPQLGRRARGIKMWMLLRYFGISGLRSRVQEHLDLARHLASLIDEAPDFERLAPVPFGLVCFRWRPVRHRGREEEPEVAAALDRLNERLMNALNESGRLFLSHTKVEGRFTLRIAIGNIRTERRHIDAAWQLVRAVTVGLDGELA